MLNVLFIYSYASQRLDAFMQHTNSPLIKRGDIMVFNQGSEVKPESIIFILFIIFINLFIFSI